jgi:isocitrate/isopropylmalate dehydrogenase
MASEPGTGGNVVADAVERLREHDAVRLGAVGDPSVPDHVTLGELLLPMRRPDIAGAASPTPSGRSGAPS